MIRRPVGWLERLVESGDYERAARQCADDAELAQMLGATKDALRKARIGMRERGARVPTVQELRYEQPVIGGEFETEEPTQPGRPAAGGCLTPGSYSPDCFCAYCTRRRRDLSSETKPQVEDLSPVEEHRLRRRVRDLEAENRALVEQLSEGGEYNDVIREVLARQDEYQPAIAPRERTSGIREATPLVLASDWHIEEEVRPEQVAGRNRYNLDISTRRMERFFESVRWGVNHQRQVFKIRDLICWWGGDFITNFLHDDNVESNLLHPTEALLMAESNIIRGIDYWLEDSDIEQFVFPCNDGNHGRLTDHTRAATRTQNSLEVFLYAHLAQHYRDEPRVRFILPTSQFTFLSDVYGRTIRFTHGDTFRYAGGVGGLMIPLFKAMANWESVKRADLTCVAHWHQRICLPTVMVNGSLIGYSPYAMSINAKYEPPVQSMRMLDALRWCSTDVPLWVADRHDDQEAAA